MNADAFHAWFDIHASRFCKVTSEVRLADVWARLAVHLSTEEIILIMDDVISVMRNEYGE